MDLPALHYGLAYRPVQLGIGLGAGDAHARGLLGHGGLRPGPDDIVDAEVIGVDGFLSAFEIQHGRETGLVDPEIVEPGAVLAELVAVVFVLGRGLYVADEYGQARFAFEEGLEGGPACGIGFFAKHTTKIIIKS